MITRRFDLAKAGRKPNFKPSTRIAEGFEATFRTLILRTPLFDTGDLWRSVYITIDVNPRSIFSRVSGTFEYVLNIYAEEYLCYHLIPTQLLTRFRRSNGFAKNQKQLKEEIIKYLNDNYTNATYKDISLELVDIVIINQPTGGGTWDFFKLA